MEPKSEENESNTSSDADDMVEQDDPNPMPTEVQKQEEDLKSIWARIKLHGQKLTALGSNALDKKEQNFTDLRKTVVDLIKDAISLGIKDEVVNTLIVDGDIYGSFQFSKNKRRRKHDGKKDEELYCRICGTKETSEWRRGQDGSKSLCNACGLHYSKILKKERSNASKGNGAIKVNNLLNPPSDDSSESDPQPTPFHPQPNIQRMTFQMQQTPTVYNFHSYTPQPAPNNSPVNNTHHQLPSNPMNPNFKMQRISQPIPKPPDVNTDLTRQDFIARQLPPNPNASQNASIIIHPPLQSWKQ